MGDNAVVSSLAGNCRRVLSDFRRRLTMACFLGRHQEGKDHALQVEEKLSLGPKKMLYLVRCREKEFLIAAGADAIVSVVEVASTKPGETRGSMREFPALMQK